MILNYLPIIDFHCCNHHVEFSVINATIRSAFEFGGQKCSACSRAYVPKSLWPKIKEGLLEKHKKIKLGDVSGCDQAFLLLFQAKSVFSVKFGKLTANSFLGRIDVSCLNFISLLKQITSINRDI